MKSDKLQDALGYIKDEYIEEAHAESTEQKVPAKKYSPGRKRWISAVAAAACLVVVITGGVIGLNNGGRLGSKGAGGQTAVSDLSEAERASGYGASDEPAGGNTMIPNPVKKSTAAEIEELDGVRIVLPEGASNAEWTRITSDPVIDQVDFRYKGKDYCYRVSRCDEGTDISGMYFDWKDHMIADTEDGGYYIDMNKGAEGVMHWHRGDCEFSVSMTKGASEKDLSKMYGLLSRNTAVKEKTNE